MKLHPRYWITKKAENEFNEFMFGLSKKHKLTDIETLQIFNSFTATMLKYALRYERHGDAGKEGDLVADE